MEGKPCRESLHDFETSPRPLGLSAWYTTHSISIVPQGLQCFQSLLRACTFCLPHSSPQHTEVSFPSYCPVSCYRLIVDNVSCMEILSCELLQTHSRQCLSHGVTVQMSAVEPKSTAPSCLKFQECSKPEPKAKRTPVQGSRRMGANVCLSISPLSSPCPPI